MNLHSIVWGPKNALFHQIWPSLHKVWANNFCLEMQLQLSDVTDINVAAHHI